MPIALLFALTIGVAALDISEMNPDAGDILTITGVGSPGESVKLSSGFQMRLPVQAGSYEYIADGVQIPQKPNKLSVKARNIQDLNLGVKMGIWLSKGSPAKDGAASMSQGDVPPGKYALKIFGKASEGASEVIVDVSADTTVKADSSGAFSLDVDTSGIPEGEYTISAMGETRTVMIGGGDGAREVHASDEGAKPRSSSSPAMSSQTNPIRNDPVQITPDVVTWYAGTQGLSEESPGEIALAEKRLRSMTSGGYWKVIARGDPLTEAAGDCNEVYCLVRDKGACRDCREKEMSMAREKAVVASDLDAPANAPEGAPAAAHTVGSSPAEDATSSTGAGEGGFISWILSLIRSIIGG